MKKIILLLLVAAMVGGVYFYYQSQSTPKPPVDQNNDSALGTDPRNATYLIGDEEFTLVDGSAEKSVALDSASSNVLTIYNQPVYGDINGDGGNDAALILVNQRGGSGTFYYAAIAADVNGSYRGTDAILLGDRIQPGTITISNNRAKINYRTHAADAALVDTPTVEQEIHLQFDPTNFRLKQIAADFAGEANPDQMSLEMQTWTWIRTTYANDTELLPADPTAFTMSFAADGTFSATTDCNHLSGTYETNQNQIIFGPIAATRMFCPESQEQDFVAMLDAMQTYSFTSRGELIIDLKFDSGTAVFR